MPQFSIIVPVYNIAEYLPKCIDSVLSQTSQDYELLLVDDGSPDTSGTICDDYASRYPDKIRVIHQPNGGAGAARNQGIRLSQGEYILFLDGDDYWEPNLLADLQTAMKSHNADLYLFGAKVEKDGKPQGELHEHIPCGELCNAQSHPELFFGIMAPWNRAYRRSLFLENGIEFASKVWYEDIRVVTKINTVAKSALRLPGAYYHYLQRDGSSMNNKNLHRNREIIYAFDDMRQWFHSHKLEPLYGRELSHLALEHLYVTATVRVLQIDRRSELIEEFRSYMQTHFPDYAQSPYLPLLGKNRVLIFRLLQKKRYRSVLFLMKCKALLTK